MSIAARLASLLTAALSVLNVASAQTPIWTASDNSAAFQSGANPMFQDILDFSVFRLDERAMRGLLSRAPREEAARLVGEAMIELPMPNGTLQRFRIFEAPTISGQAARTMPGFRSYAGRGVDDREATVRLDMSSSGFRAFILSPNGDVLVDPVRLSGGDLYASYFKRDYAALRAFQCLTKEKMPPRDGGIQPAAFVVLKTYRLAMNATGEYTAFFGGAPQAQNAVGTAVNRVTGVYERDFGIRLNMTYVKCWTNAATDPYSNNNGGAMLSQNQTETDLSVGNANYDIGHVFSTGGGGVAGLRVVGITGQKARGVTGSPSPTGDPFVIDYVAHEMGHQYGGNHTFNGTSGACAGNRVASAAYEPGSGSTIMAYAGICGAEDVQPNSDDYFHTKSFDEIMAWKNNPSSGGASTTTSNNVPSASAGPDFTIPQSTPFRLTGSGSDADGDALTYCWEQFDLGPASPNADITTRPLIRSRKDTASPTRFIPQLPDVLSNASTPWELLPNVNRIFTFRCTVRDNRAGGGGSAYDTMVVTVSGAPFSVTAPNTAVTWAGGSTQTVTWNKGGSTSANVNILLSLNGGSSYGTGGATVLLANTPNDGSEQVVVPNIATSQARIIVEGAGNIFYDVSNTNFTITFTNSITVAPSAFQVLQGNLASGSLADLQTSNDSYVVVNLLKTARAQPTITQVEGVSSILAPSKIEIAVEASGFPTGMTQLISAWDFVNSAWVLLDTSTATTADQTRIATITTNPARYVQPGTGLVRIKVSQDMFARSISTRLDFVSWKVYQ